MNLRLILTIFIISTLLPPMIFGKRITQKEINFLFDLVDHNNDNRISRSEWKWDLAGFRGLDRNKNGFISRNEVNIKKYKSDLWDAIKFMDTDSNNQINKKEWLWGDANFNMVDNNRNGIINKNEAGNFILTGKLKSFKPVDPWLWTVLKKHDRNNDNRISSSEWPWLPKGFKKNDKNKNGFVTKEEVRSDWSKFKFWDVIKFMDSNGDNRISRKEWKWGDRWFKALDKNYNGFINKKETR